MDFRAFSFSAPLPPVACPEAAFPENAVVQLTFLETSVATHFTLEFPPFPPSSLKKAH